MSFISIKGARVNNLKNISVDIPRNKFVVVTGLSGSGKSSLIFDTLFAKAQNEYLESLSTYARTSLPNFDSPDVDLIEGLSPCIVIDQRAVAKNPRSTVGTFTEIYTYLRLLYSRLGNTNLSAADFSFNNPTGACENCDGLGVELVPILDKLIDLEKSLDQGAIKPRAWKIGSRYLNIIKATRLFNMNKSLKDFSKEELDLLLYSKPKSFLSKDPNFIQNFTFEGVVSRLIRGLKDKRGQKQNAESMQYFEICTCKTCNGSRINKKAREVYINGKNIVDLVTIEIKDLIPLIKSIKDPVAEPICNYIIKSLENIVRVGIGYLSLSRSVATLSGGEAQKLKLAKQLGSSLTEIIYVLDEPTSGLHARDSIYLSKLLKDLSKNNSVIVIEHDRDFMLSADYIIDLGPGAGIFGGEIIGKGKAEDILKLNTPTGNYLSERMKISIRKNRRISKEYIKIKNANMHNLKKINLDIPKKLLCCITGVSGSGKSSLVEYIIKNNSDIVILDQSQVGKNSRSIVATYTSLFKYIREIFSKISKKDVSYFSFNGKGCCKACCGLGYNVIDMHFLGSINKLCNECEGKRYNKETLNYLYKEKNIYEILDMTVVEAYEFFKDYKDIKNILELLKDTGLDYLKLGQSLSTLSGGEAQRIKIVSKLSIKGEIYILDEPTRGLHFKDIDILLSVLNKLVDNGNSVIVIEHNLDFIKNADYIIDLGPEGGDSGGEIIAQGTPEELIKVKNSYTGQFLKKILEKEKK
ncbi:MAG: excinuclease ABC subunit UvrA [archaeon]